jgi:acetyl esterase/lipase
LEALGVGIAVLLLAWTLLLYVPVRWRPVGLYLFVPKLAAGAFTPFIAAAGLLLALVGVLVGSWWLAVPAGRATVGASIVIVRLGLVRADLAAALGPDWADRISPQRRARMVGRGWRGRLPTTLEPRLRRDIVFATVPGSGRKLLCDVWQPPAGVPSSGLAVVYLHGGAGCMLDKDAWTRPLFRHLAAQGHVIVDVAYRLFPETDIPGMVADAKRALAWLRTHAADLEVRPDRIVLAGGSAGAHLALLAAYAPDDPTLTPAELGGSDPRVCGVVSLYGQADLAAHYDHTGQQKVCRPDDPRPDWDAPPPPWMLRPFGPDADRLKLHHMAAGRLDWLVGGTPSQMPDRYAQLSPVHRVHPGCPPTLLSAPGIGLVLDGRAGPLRFSFTSDAAACWAGCWGPLVSCRVLATTQNLQSSRPPALWSRHDADASAEIYPLVGFRDQEEAKHQRLGPVPHRAAKLSSPKWNGSSQIDREPESCRQG